MGKLLRTFTLDLTMQCCRTGISYQGMESRDYYLGCKLTVFVFFPLLGKSGISPGMN